MNAAQIHLAFNHFPVAGVILALGVLLWGFFARNDQIKIVGITLIFVSALTSIVVMTSGEGAEDIVKRKPLVTKEIIHHHEEAAEAAMISIQLSALVGVAWLVMRRLKKSHLEKVFALIVLITLVSAVLAANAAHKGGMIRHDELRERDYLNLGY